MTANPNIEDDDTRDINDIFDEIACSEDTLEQEGYDEGYAEAAASGNPEGYHLGYHRGAELGAELGYYTGVVEVYLKTVVSDKQRAVLETLQKALSDFPVTNDEQADIFELANTIRAQFRRCCALLKISGRYPEVDTLSF